VSPARLSHRDTEFVVDLLKLVYYYESSRTFEVNSSLGDNLLSFAELMKGNMSSGKFQCDGCFVSDG